MKLNLAKLKDIKKQIIKSLMLFSGTLFLLNIPSYADSNNILSTSIVKRPYGDLSGDTLVINTSDNGFLTIENNYYNAKITKCDKNKKEEWTSSIEGNSETELQNVIEVNTGFIAIGTSEATDLGFDNKGSLDVILIKYNKNGEKEWVKSFGGSNYEIVSSAIRTSDGGIAIAGSSNSVDMGINNKGIYDAFIAYCNEYGDLKWIKGFGGSKYDCFNSLIQASNGDFIAVGQGYLDKNRLLITGSDNALVVRYDQNGNQKWVSSLETGVYSSVLETSTKNLIAVGYNDEEDAIISKYDANGNFIWTKTLGGSNFDEFKYVLEMHDRSYLVIGNSDSTDADFNNEGKVDIIVAKYDTNGNKKWVKNIGTSGDDTIYSTKVISNDGLEFIISTTGFMDLGFTSTNNWSNLITVKYKEEYTNYESLFDKISKLTSLDSSVSSFTSNKKTSDGGFVAVGNSNSKSSGFINYGESDAILVKYNKDAKKEWIKSWGGSKNDSFDDVIETSDGGFIAVGKSDSTDAGFIQKGSRDAIIIKYDSNGNQEWINSLGGSDSDWFSSVVEMDDGSFIATGSSYSNDAGFTNRGGADALLVKYSKDGNQLWIKNFGTSRYGLDSFGNIVKSDDGGFVVAGAYQYGTDLDFSHRGGIDAVIVKFDSNGNQEWINSFGGSDWETFYGLTKTLDGGFIAVGYTASTNAGLSINGSHEALIIKYDSLGNQLWSKSFGGSNSEYFYSVAEISNGNILAVGKSSSSDAGFTQKGSTDAIIVMYTKDGNQLWVKNFGGSSSDGFESLIEIDEKIVIVGDSSSTDIESYKRGALNAIIVVYNKYGEEVWSNSLQDNPNAKVNINEFNALRKGVNSVSDNELREYLNDKINNIDVDLGGIELKTASSNLDVYIKSENMLLLSLDTNSITFEDFSGIEDVIKSNAVNISINSSLPYQLNAYLPVEIQNSDKTNIMDKRILNIKENGEADYKEFTNINEKVVLKDNCPAGNDLVHGVDIKLRGGIAHEKDVYKTTIKFEAEQK